MRVECIRTEIEKASSCLHLSNLSFETQDALCLETTDRFDAVVSFNALHWISNKIKALHDNNKSINLLAVKSED